MIKSSNILKVTAAIMLILGCVVSSCKLTGCEECTIEIDQELDKIRQGDFAAYKNFMQKHPDPEYKCCVTNSVINSEVHKLKNAVRSSLDIEIITDFFSYNLSQDTKNDFLNVYWTGSKHEEITRFLINQGCKIKYTNYCDSTFLEGLKKINKLGYDMNYIDPKYGTNLFLDFSAIGYEQKVFKDGECAVECLKYLKSIGVDTKLKDADGKTALELASDPIIIDYLKGI